MKASEYLIALTLFAGLFSNVISVAQEILYETGFEAPTFDASLPIRDQDSWEMWHNGFALLIATENARTGQQCLRIDGQLLEVSGVSARAYGFYNSIVDRTPPIVEIRSDVRLDGPQIGTNGTPAQDLISANLMAVVPKPGGEGQLLAGFFVSGAGRIWTYSSVPEDNYKFSLPYTFGTYRTLALQVDFVARSVTYLVDGVKLGTLPFPAAVTTDQLISGYLELHGQEEPVNQSDVTYDRSNYTAYFDNYRLTSIPVSSVNTSIRFSQELFLAEEHSGKARVTLERTGAIDSAVRVKVATTNDTAKAGEDYEAYTANVNFAAGEKSKTFEITLRDDFAAEPDKRFKLTLTELPPGATSARMETQVLIRDDDRLGSIDPQWSYTLDRPRGTKDQAFQVSMFEQPDGKVVATLLLEGTGQSVLVRLNPDGSIDSTFHGELHGSPAFVALAPEGKIMLLENTGGVPRMRRLNADGSPDDSFSAEVQADVLLIENFLTVLPDGRMLVPSFAWVGGFLPTVVNGEEMPNLIRLNRDGTHDPTFLAPADLQPSVVRQLLSGKILVGTLFSSTPVYRLNEAGAIDPTFKLAKVTKGGNEEDPYALSLLSQPDGKILLTGQFHQVNGQVRNSIVRLNADGTVDESFRTGTGFTIGGKPGSIEARLLPSGHVLISPYGAGFDQFDGQSVPRFSLRAPFIDTKAAPLLLNSDGSWNRDFAVSEFDWGIDPAGGVPSGLVVSIPLPVGVADGQPLFATGWGLGRLNLRALEVPVLPKEIVQQAYLKASNSQGSPNGGDQFGSAAAISGNTLVIGAPWEGSNARGVNGNQSDNRARGAGAAYVFVREGTHWRQQAYLKASNTEASDNPSFNVFHNDNFGSSVAIHGDTLVIGAPDEQSSAQEINGDQEDNSAGGAGAAYVFTRSGSTWTQQAYLKASNAEAGDGFGFSVGVSGNTVVVGAHFEGSVSPGVNGDTTDNSAKGSGAAYVFTRTGTTWSQQAYLKASHPGGGVDPIGRPEGDFFGSSVAIDADTVVVGAIGEDGNGKGVTGDPTNNSSKDSGAAYVFIRNGGTWSQQAYLKASQTSPGMTFGSAVAISGETLVVGANTANRNQASSQPGTADVFVRQGASWAHQAQLKPSHAQANDWFGHSVAIEGNVVLIGAPQEGSDGRGVNGVRNNRSAEYSGAAYLYTRDGTVWTETANLKSSNSDESDVFGAAVGLSGGTAVVGAAYEASNADGVDGNSTDNSAYEAGAAYVFVLPATAPKISITLSRDVPGPARLLITTQAGQRYTLQTSSDLRNWSDLKSETAVGTTLEFQDPLTAERMFYRVRRD